MLANLTNITGQYNCKMILLRYLFDDTVNFEKLGAGSEHEATRKLKPARCREARNLSTSRTNDIDLRYKMSTPYNVPRTRLLPKGSLVDGTEYALYSIMPSAYMPCK